MRVITSGCSPSVMPSDKLIRQPGWGGRMLVRFSECLWCKAHLGQLEFGHLGNLALFWHGILRTLYRCCRPPPLWSAVVGWMCRQSWPETRAVCFQSSICSVPSQYLTHLEVICVGKNETASRQQRQQANWEPLGVEGTSIALGWSFMSLFAKLIKADWCFCENLRAVWRLSTFNPWRFC